VVLLNYPESLLKLQCSILSGHLRRKNAYITVNVNVFNLNLILITDCTIRLLVIAIFRLSCLLSLSKVVQLRHWLLITLELLDVIDVLVIKELLVLVLVYITLRCLVLVDVYVVHSLTHFFLLSLLL